MRLMMGSVLNASNIRGIPGGGGEPLLFTDFSQDTVGEFPPDWNYYYGSGGSWTVDEDAGADGGKILQFTGSGGSGRKAMAFTPVPEASDMIITIKARPRNSSAAQIHIVARADISGPLTWYECRLNNGGFNINRWSNGSFTQLGSTAVDAPAGTAWYMLKFQLIGSALKAKFWAAVDEEPAAWTLEVTNSTHVSGFSGISVDALSSSYFVDFDFFDVTLL